MNFIKNSNTPKDQISTLDVNVLILGFNNSGATKHCVPLICNYFLNIYCENSNLQLSDKLSAWDKMSLFAEKPKSAIFKVLSLVINILWGFISWWIIYFSFIALNPFNNYLKYYKIS